MGRKRGHRSKGKKDSLRLHPQLIPVADGRRVAPGAPGNRWEVASAGTAPTGVHPCAVAVMAEIGIDIRDHRAKGLDAFQGIAFDEVVTVCDHAQESCPVVPGGGVKRHQSFGGSGGGKGDGGGGSCGFPAGPGRDPELDYGNLLKRRGGNHDGWNCKRLSFLDRYLTLWIFSGDDGGGAARLLCAGRRRLDRISEARRDSDEHSDRCRPYPDDVPPRLPRSSTRSSAMCSATSRCWD